MNEPKYIPGDWVRIKENIVQVEGAVLVGFNNSYEYIVRFEYGNHMRMCEFELDSIFLTSSILEKNGWKKIDIMPFPSYAKGKTLEYGLFYPKGKGWMLKYEGRVIRTGIENVHDLQHLLFGLGLNNEMEVRDV